MTSVKDPDGRSLDLAERGGLPDRVAFLRGRFPAATWAAHPNYGELAVFWRDVHVQLRREGAEVGLRLRTLMEEPGPEHGHRAAFLRDLRRHLSHLDLHHRVEDEIYFPRFQALDPRMATGFDLLERDHSVIHARLQDVVDSADGLLRAFEVGGDAVRRAAKLHAGRAELLLRLLDRHLDDEEDLVIPALLAHGERAVS